METITTLAQPETSTAGRASALPGAPDLRRVVHPQWGDWLTFKKTLVPKYASAWMEIALCLAMLLSGFSLHLFVTLHFGNTMGLILGIPCAVWIGFWLQSILCFGHEAAHFNLSNDHVRNDFLADWTVWLFFPQDTKHYRAFHWPHHLHLGDTEDTETSYHNCLSPWFLAKTITGVYLIEVARRYVFRGSRSNSTREDRVLQQQQSGTSAAFPILRAMSVHLLFIVTAIWLHCYATAVVWLVAAGVVFPSFATVRQILEHRTIAATCETDFQKVNHGPVNRLFGKGLFSHYYGSAGFNRHLLHHWDPTVSYTRFDEMEAFFNHTGLADEMQDARSTYIATFLVLLRQSLRDPY